MNKYYFWGIILTCQLLSAQNPNKITLAKVDVVGNTNTSKTPLFSPQDLDKGNWLTQQISHERSNGYGN